jgi:hypothetical protein
MTESSTGTNIGMMDRIRIMDTSTRYDAKMPRRKGSGRLGPVRSLRLPADLDRWFEVRLRSEPRRPASDILIEAVHGGLRLRPGYMRRHYLTLAAFVCANDFERYQSYLRALADSFGDSYVQHIEAWLNADGHNQFVDVLHARTRDRTHGTLESIA